MRDRSTTATLALAPTLWPERATGLAGTVLLVVLGTLVLTLSAKIQVPFWPVPMTLQTFAVMALAAVYGSRLAVLTVLAYLAEGFAGLPVFVNTPPMLAGPAYFMGPTGGFLAGFVALAFIVGSAADRGWDRSVPKLFGAMLAAEIVVFAMGLAWLGLVAVPALGLSWRLLEAGLFPFVLGDLVKIALAAALIPALRTAVRRRGA